MFFLAGAAASSALDLISSLQQALGGSSTSAQSPATFDPASTPGTATTPQTPTANVSTSASASAGLSTPLSSSTLNALFSLQGQQGQPLLAVNGDALSKEMFSLLDSNGDGGISQSEFDAAFGQNGKTTQANSLFAKLDTNGDGTVSLQELTNALDGQDQSGAQGVSQGSDTQGAHHHHHHGGGFDIASLLGGVGGLGGAGGAGGAGGSAGNNANDPFAQNGSSQSVTNTDGSTTTTITYSDGSQVTMTIPGAGNSSSGSGSGGNSVGNLNNFIEQMIQRQAQMLASSAAGQSVAVSA